MMEQTQNERGRITPIFKKLDYDATRSTPQGGVISPILSNLFLHYTFDLWMGRRVTPIASMADFLFAQLNDRSPSRTTERHSGHIKDRGGQLIKGKATGDRVFTKMSPGQLAGAKVPANAWVGPG